MHDLLAFGSVPSPAPEGRFPPPAHRTRVRISRTGLSSETIRCSASHSEGRAREGLNNPHLGRNAIGCGLKIRFEGLSER